MTAPIKPFLSVDLAQEVAERIYGLQPEAPPAWRSWGDYHSWRVADLLAEVGRKRDDALHYKMIADKAIRLAQQAIEANSDLLVLAQDLYRSAQP